MRFSLSGPLLSHLTCRLCRQPDYMWGTVSDHPSKGCSRVCQNGSGRRKTRGKGGEEEIVTAPNRVPRHEGFLSPHVRRPLYEHLLCAACATRPGGGARRSKTAQVLLLLIVWASKDN